MWNADIRSQLLFIFPTRANLATITLHYYNDNDRGLPRLRFYAVPDDFDVWDAPAASYYHGEVAAVPQDEWPAGRRNVSVYFDLGITLTKLLMMKFRSTLSFAVNEVEFFNHCCKLTASVQ